MKLQDKFRELTQQGRGILATNFYNYETLHGVLAAAAELNEPLILQATRSSINYLGLQILTSMARAGIDQFGVEAWLHLDHGDSYELVKKCLDAGFDSVMIDASEMEFEQNVELTAKVAELAKKYGANVEAELGYVAKLGQKENANGYTKPEQASRFRDLTQVDALAIAIGSAHGFYKKEPHLQVDLLSEIRKATDVTLVLHGSSGIPEHQLKEAIRRGICKVNLATEIKNIFMYELRNQMSHSTDIDLRKVFPPAIKAIKELVKEKLLIVKGH